MKCNLCTWNEMPNVIPRIESHAKADHRGIDTVVVWRDQELVLTTTPDEDDTELTYYYKAE